MLKWSGLVSSVGRRGWRWGVVGGKLAVFGLVGTGIVLATLVVHVLNGKPELSLWHTVHLDEEFKADMAVEDFAGYLAVEERVFGQLEREVSGELEERDRTPINRYCPGSLADPARVAGPGNRTFELVTAQAKAGVLLLHGMSDSPYSLRRVGEALHAKGASVIGLRLPGHGTIPSGLIRVEWEDMAAAVRLAVVELKKRVGDKPLHIVGYSNGGALAVEYAMASVEGRAVPAVDGIVLISPAVGVSKMAGLAVWQGRLGRVLGLQKLAWTAVLPEYDPFKYGSFAVNAGHQVHRLTLRIASGIEGLEKAGKVGDFPAVLAFQSSVDATVSARSLVSVLFQRLNSRGHELVLFDINRRADVEHVLKRDPREDLADLIRELPAEYTISHVTNANPTSAEAVVRTHRWREDPVERRLGIEWPTEVYSLAHVSLPFAQDDPVYGRSTRSGVDGIRLGDLALRGERGVLTIAAADMLRLRWNPFYAFMEERIIGFVVPDGAGNGGGG